VKEHGFDAILAVGGGLGGVTDHHAARPTRGPHHCREVPRKDDTTATFSLQLERAKWAENQVRLMYGILKKGRGVQSAIMHLAWQRRPHAFLPGLARGRSNEKRPWHPLIIILARIGCKRLWSCIFSDYSI
jgi:hypothetical protein